MRCSTTIYYCILYRPPRTMASSFGAMVATGAMNELITNTAAATASASSVAATSGTAAAVSNAADNANVRQQQKTAGGNRNTKYQKANKQQQQHVDMEASDAASILSQDDAKSIAAYSVTSSSIV